MKLVRPVRFAPALLIAVLGVVVASVPGCAIATGSGDGGNAAAELATVPADRETGDERSDGALEVAGDTVPVRPEVSVPTEWDSEIEEVYGRYWLYWEAFAAAHAPPNADPSFAPLESLSTPANWRSLEQQLRGFADDGLVLVLPKNSITEHLIRIPNASVLVKEEGAEVVLQDCWIDDFVQQTVDGQVLLATEEAKLMNVMMKVVNGQWRVDGVARATADSDGFEQCVTLVSQ